MDTALLVLVSLLVGGVALAFYMDWLGLWVSKEEMREQIDRAKERMSHRT
jgi:NhaP-type Na+/H+ or K+/H+ antiporter